MIDLRHLTHEELIRVVGERVTGTPPQRGYASSYLRAPGRDAIRIEPYKKRRRAARVLVPAVPTASDDPSYADFFTATPSVLYPQMAQFA